MLNASIAMNTKGWTAGQRVKLLREATQEGGYEHSIPWEDLMATDFFIAPASTKYHGAYVGGLFDHSMNVVNTLCYLSAIGVIEWQRVESPMVVGLFHDATKIGKYAVNETNDGFIYAPKEDTPIYGGHGAESVIRVQQWMELTEEEAMCIRFHMGAYEKDDWEAYDLAIKRYPNVLWTHTADMVASKILES